MDIQAEKIELVKMLLDTDDPEIINRLKMVFEEDHDFYDDLPNHVKDDIDAATDEIAKGQVYDHEFVMNEFKVKYGIKD